MRTFVNAGSGLAFLIVFTAAMQAQGPGVRVTEAEISTSDLPAYGLRLLRSADPEALGALPSLRNAEAKSLLPYAIVFNNKSGKDLLAYHIRWLCTAPNGKVITQDIVIYDFNRLAPGDAVLRSGEERVVSSFGNSGLDDPIDTSHTSEMASHALFLGRQSKIVVSLELAIFEDGSAVGPDGAGWLPRLKAWMDAERDIAATVNTTAPEDLEDFLNVTVTNAAEIGTSAQPHDFYRIVNSANTYDEAYPAAKAYFAVQLIRKIHSSSPVETIKSVREYTSKKIYRSIHR